MITKPPTESFQSEAPFHASVAAPKPDAPARESQSAKSFRPTEPPAWLVQVQEALGKGVQSLLEQTFDSIVSAPEWDELGELLESFPLPTAQFALAMNRLNNARNYFVAGEPGAARFELRLLVGGLLRS